MKNSVILVGEDKSLLEARAGRLSKYFKVTTSNTQKAVNVLGRTECDLLLLCESIPPESAAFLIFSIRCYFPLLKLVRLEKENSVEVPLYFQADHIVRTSSSSTEWMEGVRKACNGTPQQWRPG